MRCVADVGATLGEGPVWVEREQALYWVDIPQKRVFRWSEGDGAQIFPVTRHVCSLAPRASGGFVGGGYDGFLSLDADLAIEVIGDPEPLLPHNRFNDAKLDRSGRLWAGTMDRHEQETSGALYRLDHDLTWTRVDSGYHVTNGPAFTIDGRTMYHTDSARQTVFAYEVDQRGVRNRRVHLQFREGDGYPDGMTVDAEDCLWIAFWDGWCVRRFSPAGAFLAEVPVPVQRPTSVAFGGSNLERLFITTASRDLTTEERRQQPQAGGLFVTEPGVRGVPDTLFAG